MSRALVNCGLLPMRGYFDKLCPGQVIHTSRVMHAAEEGQNDYLGQYGDES